MSTHDLISGEKERSGTVSTGWFLMTPHERRQNQRAHQSTSLTPAHFSFLPTTEKTMGRRKSRCRGPSDDNNPVRWSLSSSSERIERSEGRKREDHIEREEKTSVIHTIVFLFFSFCGLRKELITGQGIIIECAIIISNWPVE